MKFDGFVRETDNFIAQILIDRIRIKILRIFFKFIFINSNLYAFFKFIFSNKESDTNF